MTVSKLDDEARAVALDKLPHWAYDAQAQGIRRTLRFADFAEAFGFMTGSPYWRRRPTIIPNGSMSITGSRYC